VLNVGAVIEGVQETIVKLLYTNKTYRWCHMKRFDEWPEIMTPKDVIEYLELPDRDVWEMFKNRDFPLVVPGKLRGRYVGKYSLREYINRGMKIEQ
jgi:hypothetical protein